MNGAQRMYAYVKFMEKLAELHGEAFEGFFHDVMCARYPDFLDVRTHGNLGDQGSDGLSLHGGKLYACYAPATFDVAKVRKKFHDDLDSARRQRPGQFSTFVFVHNDLRGIHPEVATMLAEARTAHTPSGSNRWDAGACGPSCCPYLVRQSSTFLAARYPSRNRYTG